AEKLNALRQMGVNRLSMGVQSSHSDELVLLGRIHTWAEAVDAFTLARKAGFDNISMDLMYGLPGQALQPLEETLERVLALEPDHLSLYALTLEPGTPLAETLALGDIPVPDPDLAADMYDAASQHLLDAGFWQYEISNWARSDVLAPELWALPESGNVDSIGTTISQHNVIYWRNEAWLGIGAGAHSWLYGRRFSHHPHPQSYIHAVHAGDLRGIDNEIIPTALAQDETLMLGLRLVEGVSSKQFRERWGVGLTETYGATIDKLVSYGLLIWQEGRLRLTTRARLLGNQIFQEFLR
ncbi:MAG: radical SAM protein, partial [Anaerolineales bacterium]